MFAIIRTGSKQYKVEPGQKIKIEKINAKIGEEAVFNDVLLIAESGKGEGEIKRLEIGKPIIEGARVIGKVTKQSRLKKVIVFKYKPKKREEKKKGHRQFYTEVEIEKIEIKKSSV